MRTSRNILTALLLVAATASCALAAPPAASPKTAPAAKPATETATFAMGCFWSAEVTFEGRPGVLSVTSGYSGGTMKDPSYEDVSTGMTGHLESIEVAYDPAKTSYAKLLDLFWHNIDPMQADGQFCDHGTEYHSAIFYHDETQHRLAMESEKQVQASGRLKKPIVTAIRPASAFYAAEDYHQDFFRKNPDHYHAYRVGCGRDRRLIEIWGKLDAYAPGIEQVFAGH